MVRLVLIVISILVVLMVGAYWIITPQGFCNGSLWNCFIHKERISLAGIQLLAAYILLVLVLLGLALFWLFKGFLKSA